VPQGHENCDPWAIRVHSPENETRVLHELIPPEPGSTFAFGLCGGGVFLSQLHPYWQAWNKAWDDFEKFHRANAWISPQPAFLFDETTGEYLVDPAAELKLLSKSDTEFVIDWNGIVLANVSVPEMAKCPDPDASESDCGWRVLALYTSPMSILLHLGYEHGSLHRAYRITAPNAPHPLIYCAPASAPLVVDLPTLLSLVDDKKHQQRAFSTPPLQAPSRPQPDLRHIDELLRLEIPVPQKLTDSPEKHRDHLIRDPLYRKLAAAFQALVSPEASGRYAYLDRWLAYVKSPEADAQQQQDEKRLALEEAQDERKRKAEEKRILTSVPAMASRCKVAIKQWHEANKQMERSAIAGNPSQARRASETREKAKAQICEAAKTLRTAIHLYQVQGLSRAATAIENEHSSCLRSCK